MARVCREAPGSATCTTLAGTARMEIYPVGTLTAIQWQDPVNKLVNPSTIVMYADDSVTDNTVTIIEISRYQPTNLNISEDDDRVVWNIDNSLGGDAKFYKGDNKGKRVRVYGTRAGEIVLEADYGWINKAKFRALVAPIQQIKFRVSRLSTNTFQPTPTISDIKKHIRIANIYLRQAGIKLVPSDNRELASGAGNPKAGDPGIPAAPPFPALPSNDPLIDSISMVEKGYFEVKLKDTPVGNNLVRTSGALANEEAAIRINAVNEIINISYCFQLGASVLGACRLSPVNHGAAPAGAPGPGLPRPAPSAAAIAGTHTISDSGTPSTSWVSPNGLPAGSLPTPAPPVPAGASATRTAGLATRDGPVASAAIGADPTGVPAGAVTMTLFPCRYDRSSPTLAATGSPMPYMWQPASPANRDLTLQWGLVMDGQAHSLLEFGNTLAHELGHFFGLRHRRGGGPDNLVWPQWENLMDGSSPAPDCEDLDILQAKAVHFSEILFRTNAIDTSPEYEPSDHTFGTVAGAVLGAVVGAIVGAIVGAVAGAIIGFVASGGNPAAAAAGAATGAIVGAAAGAVAGAIIGGFLGSPSPSP